MTNAPPIPHGTERPNLTKSSLGEGPKPGQALLMVFPGFRKKILGLLAGLVALMLAMAEPALARDQVTVTVTRLGQDVLATYQLPYRATEFNFHEVLIDGEGGRFVQRDLLRDDRWEVLDTGLTLGQGRVRHVADVPFDNFTIRIVPDAEAWTRVSPALVNVGEGAAIWPAYLAAAFAQYDTVFQFRAEPGDVVIAGDGAPTMAADMVWTPTRYTADARQTVYLGPQAYVSSWPFGSGEIRMVAPPDLPDWVMTLVTAQAANSRAFYQDRFGVPPGASPTFLIALGQEGPGAGWRGEVSADGLIVMRLRGRGWQRPTAVLQEDLSVFVAHEINHLWNGGLYRQGAGDDDPWLVEGAAEYMALSFLYQTGQLAAARFDGLMITYLNNCLRYINSAEAAIEGLAGPAIYDCGAVVQWAADAGLRTRRVERGGNPDTAIFDMWQSLFALAAARGSFTPADFRTEVAGLPNGGAALAAIDILTLSPGRQDMSVLPDYLSQLGIRLINDPTALNARRSVNRLFVPILRENCAPPHGYGVRWIDGSYAVALQTGERCAVAGLNGDPSVYALEGIGIADNPTTAYDAALAACQRRGALRLTTSETGDVTVTCPAGLPSRPIFYVLAEPVALPR